MLLPAPPDRFRKPRANQFRMPRRTPPAVAPTLVSATYDPGGPSVTLTFDRAVSALAFDAAQLVVDDPVTAAARFDGGGGAVPVSPAVVEVTLAPIDLPSGTAVTMTATNATGIVSAVGAVAWAGVADLELPFP